MCIMNTIMSEICWIIDLPQWQKNWPSSGKSGTPRGSVTPADIATSIRHPMYYIFFELYAFIILTSTLVQHV